MSVARSIGMARKDCLSLENRMYKDDRTLPNIK